MSPDPAFDAVGQDVGVNNDHRAARDLHAERSEQPAVRLPGRTASLFVCIAGFVIAAAPFAIAGRALAGGWRPTNDWAVIVARAADTVSAHPPLIGQWSTASMVAHHEVHQPGPLQFWFLGVFEWIFSPSSGGALIGSAVFATAAFATALVVAWRHGGARGLTIMVIVLALFLAAMDPQVLTWPYNPTFAAIGFIGFLAAAWAALDRDGWWLPVAVVFACCSAQAHLSFALPVTAGALVVVVILARDQIRARARTSIRPVSPRVLAISLAVGILCWIGPLIDQLWGQHNLSAILSSGSSNSDKAGPLAAAHWLVHQLQLPPLWYSSPGTNILHVPPLPTIPAWAYLSAALVAVAIAAGLVSAWRDRHRGRFVLGALAVASLLGTVVSQAIQPTLHARLTAHAYPRLFFWPMAPEMLFVWVFLAWCGLDALAHLGRRTTGVRLRPGLRTVGAGVLCLVVLAGVAAQTIRFQPKNFVGSSSFDAIDRFAGIIESQCHRSGGPVVVLANDVTKRNVLDGVVAMLRLSSCEVHLENTPRYGRAYAITGDEPLVFRITSSLPKAHEPGPRGYRFLASYDPAHPDPRWKGYDKSNFFIPRSPLSLYVHRR